MKAVVCERYGPPEVLRIAEIDKPPLKPDQIMVNVKSVGVTAGDCRVRAFNVPKSYRLMARMALGWRKPRCKVLGADMAGIVTEVGSKVRHFRPGDKVFGYGAGYKKGTYAEYFAISENGPVVRMPENMSFTEAGTCPVGGATALYFLESARIKKGDHLLINGASGSVGTFAVQIAKHFGAEVTAVSSGKNRALVESLGADHHIDYTISDPAEGNAIYDVVFDAVGTLNVSASMRLLKPEGTLLHAVATPDVTRKMKRAKRGTLKKTVGAGPGSKQEYMQKLRTLIESGAVTTVIDRTYSMDEIVEAHRYADTGRKIGNLAVTIQ